MKTVGSILKEARAGKHLSFDDVERSTKIRAKFIEAIEADDYNKLPSVFYAKGFVKNYAEFLGLNSNTILAFFRRQTTEVSKTSILPKGVAEPLNRPLLRLTPGRFLALVLVGLVAAFLLYFGLQYRNLQSAPKLIIDTPKEQFISHDRKLEIFGKTDSDATVTVNGVSVIVRSDGSFFDQLTLSPGINQITVVATSRYGKSVTVKREVAYQQ